MLLTARFVMGLGIGIANVICSTYVAETGDPCNGILADQRHSNSTGHADGNFQQQLLDWCNNSG